MTKPDWFEDIVSAVVERLKEDKHEAKPRKRSPYVGGVQVNAKLTPIQHDCIMEAISNNDFDNKAEVLRYVINAYFELDEPYLSTA